MAIMHPPRTKTRRDEGHRRGQEPVRCTGYTVPGELCRLVPITRDVLHQWPLCAEHRPSVLDPLALFRDVQARLDRNPPVMIKHIEGQIGAMSVRGSIQLHFRPNDEQPFALWWDSTSQALTEPVCSILLELQACLT